jgi:hypothetical protein
MFWFYLSLCDTKAPVLRPWKKVAISWSLGIGGSYLHFGNIGGKILQDGHFANRMLYVYSILDASDLPVAQA